MRILLFMLMFIIPVFVKAQEIKDKPSKSTAFIVIKCDLKQEELFASFSKFLLAQDIMIESRDKELGIIKTEPIERRGKNHISYYTIRIEDQKITIGGNYMVSNKGVTRGAIIGVKSRDVYAQIRNVDGGRIGRKQAFWDMLELAEKFGGELGFKE
jgi:hypothetical protein